MTPSLHTLKPDVSRAATHGLMQRHSIWLALALFVPLLGGSQCNLDEPQTQGECARSCAQDSDCGDGQFCVQGQCSPKAKFCFNGIYSASDRGDVEDCTPFMCDEATGTCLRNSTATSDCAPGYVADGAGRCVPNEAVDYLPPKPARPVVDMSCYPQCHADADCSGFSLCHFGKCVFSQSYCLPEENGGEISVQLNLAGRDGAGDLERTYECCKGYRCDSVTGGCLRQCSQSTDCASRFVCDTDQRACVPL